ncbi:reverse transcriptase domain, reverse transcriptase zinc-binding domain protein [Tanacetum coccineum]
MSFGGRLTLVKSVLGSLPLYYFLMFRVSLSVIKNLERIRKNFFWGGVGEGKKLSWVKWDSVIASHESGGEEMDGVGLEFSSSFIGELGDGRDIRFWVDRNIRGRVSKEFDDLTAVLQNVSVSNNCRERWRWAQVEDGVFKVKELTRLVEEKILHVESGGQETIWNKLVPKKVNIFVWRALKGRLPVRVELDRRGIDLDSILCPSCDNVVESCAHSLVTCDLASVWEKIFRWWKLGHVNAFTIDEFFSSSGNVNVPESFLCLFDWPASVCIFVICCLGCYDVNLSWSCKCVRFLVLRSAAMLLCGWFAAIISLVLMGFYFALILP